MCFLVVSVLLTFFWCCPIMCLYVRCSRLWCLLRFPHAKDGRFVFISSCLYECSCLIYVSCVCMHIELSITYCVAFLFCLSSFCGSCTQCCHFSCLSIFRIRHIRVHSKRLTYFLPVLLVKFLFQYIPPLFDFLP